MQILVTGGTGFIGSHTVVELILDGHDVVIVDDLSNSKPAVVDRIADITGVAPALVAGDVRDRSLLDDVMVRHDFGAVMHFAALKAVGESVREPLRYWNTNVVGSLNLVEAMLEHDVERIVFSSSATVYGDPESVPVSEEAPTRPPSNPYGWTKLTVEQILTHVAATQPSWAVALLRYFNPVGAHPSGLIGEDPSDEPNNLMPYIARVASEQLPKLFVFGDDYPTRDGTGIRDYIHVVDLAKGHTAALNKLLGGPGVRVYNLGTGSGTTVLELVHAFESASGVTVPFEITARRPGDVARVWADPARAERELGWVAQRGIEDMCEDTWRWQKFAGTLPD